MILFYQDEAEETKLSPTQGITLAILNLHGQLTVLVDQHTDGNSGHEEPVQKVLNVVLRLSIDVVRFLELQHPLRHSFHDVLVPVPDLHQRLTESTRKACGIPFSLVRWTRRGTCHVFSLKKERTRFAWNATGSGHRYERMET